MDEQEPQTGEEAGVAGVGFVRIRRLVFDAVSEHGIGPVALLLEELDKEVRDG